MSIDFGLAAAFWGLLVIPVLWLAGPLGAFGRVSRHHPLHAAVRSLLLVALIAALSQPVLSLAASRTAIVYLVDVSDSVASRAWTQAADTIDALNAAVHPDTSRILAFAGTTASVPDSASLRRIAGGDGAEALARRVGAGATDIAQALAAARAEVPPSARGRIVLLSDGRETQGDSLEAADRLAAARIPVFTWPLAERDLGDTWIADLRVPEGAMANADADVEVVVGAQAERDVEIGLRESGRVIATRRLTVRRGVTTVSMRVRLAEPGAHVLEAVVESARDVLAENNAMAREVVVAPPLKVLYVQAEASAGTAPRALAQAGATVTIARPQEMPTRPDVLRQWDVVVLSNVARPLLSPGAMTALTTWVEDLGGGFLFVGGNAVVGESPDRAQPGYRRSEIERILPITFDRDDEPDVALVIVLDRSWSMYGTAMDLTKAAAEAAAGTLTPAQMVGVLSFNNNADWDVPLARVRDNRATLHDAIARIAASGPTAIFPALQFAYDALSTVRARAKHVILLSDGQTAPEDFEGLVARMKAARITVSSVALGPEADATLLQHIATWGGGRSYVVQNASQIPEIFVTEAKSAGKPAGPEVNTIVPIVRQASFFPPTAGPWPVLQERNVVSRKAQAIELAGTSTGDPLLTVWPAGLGRTAMFAADVDGRWTKDWVTWKGFGATLSALVHALAPRRTGSAALDVIVGERVGAQGVVQVSLEARDAQGDYQNLLTPEVVARQRDGRATLRLSQVRPGRYEARAPADLSEPIRFSLANHPERDDSARIVVADEAAEYRFGPPDEARLSAIAAETGGVLRPSHEQVRAAQAGGGVVRHALAPWLLALALLLWPVDIALRRLR